MCYLLAWSMTSPVSRLRKAAQSLAAGDLSARTGAPANGRRDELTELMRDFDRMAERIEGLVDSQSRLLKDVSHELRSPLARLSVALGLARQRATADAPPELELALNRIETRNRPPESTHPASADHFSPRVGDRRPEKNYGLTARTGGAGGPRCRIRISRTGLSRRHISANGKNKDKIKRKTTNFSSKLTPTCSAARSRTS